MIVLSTGFGRSFSAGPSTQWRTSMAYDRFDSRDLPRGDRSRWRDDRFEGRDRGFFERAGDEVAAWFGDEEAERRRREDLRFAERGRGWSPDRGAWSSWDRPRYDR